MKLKTLRSRKVAAHLNTKITGTHRVWGVVQTLPLSLWLAKAERFDVFHDGNDPRLEPVGALLDFLCDWEFSLE